MPWERTIRFYMDTFSNLYLQSTLTLRTVQRSQDFANMFWDQREFPSGVYGTRTCTSTQSWSDPSPVRGGILMRTLSFLILALHKLRTRNCCHSSETKSCGPPRGPCCLKGLRCDRIRRAHKFPSVTRCSFSSLLLGNTKINNKPTSWPGIVCVALSFFFNWDNWHITLFKFKVYHALIM